MLPYVSLFVACVALGVSIYGLVFAVRSSRRAARFNPFLGAILGTAGFNLARNISEGKVNSAALCGSESPDGEHRCGLEKGHTADHECPGCGEHWKQAEMN